MIFVSLEKGKIKLAYGANATAKGPSDLEHQSKLFSPDDTEGMAKFIEPDPERFSHIIFSSSADFPDENGLSEDFDTRAAVGKAVALAQRVTALRFGPSSYRKPGARSAAYAALDALEAGVSSRGYPCSVLFESPPLKDSKPKEVLVTFRYENELQAFLGGMGYAARIALAEAKAEEKKLRRKRR
jgi:hypothetical protein